MRRDAVDEAVEVVTESIRFSGSARGMVKQVESQHGIVFTRVERLKIAREIRKARNSRRRTVEVGTRQAFDF